MPAVSTYQQASEPTDLTPGTTWLKDDGKAYIRKLDLTWNYVGEWQQPGFNHLPLEGGTMMGPILGAHGLCAANSPNFTGTATLNSIDLADKQWTADQLTALQETLEKFISGTIDGTSGNITVGNNLAIGYSTTPLAHGATIPLPVYADNKRAALSEVWAVIPSVATITHFNNPTDQFATNNVCSVDSNLVVTCKSISDRPSVEGERTGSINYLIICKR